MYLPRVFVSIAASAANVRLLAIAVGFDVVLTRIDDDSSYVTFRDDLKTIWPEAIIQTEVKIVEMSYSEVQAKYEEAISPTTKGGARAE